MNETTHLAEEHMQAAAALDDVSSAEDTTHVDRRRERLAAIYRDQYAFVRRSLRYLGVSEPEVRDAVQGVFLVVVRKIEDFEGRSALRTWLFGICLRVAKAARRGRPSLEPLDDDLRATAGVDVDEIVAIGQAAELVARILETLDDDQRTVFVLIELEGMRAPEVAASLKLKVNTVYSRLRLARRKFDRALIRHRKRETRKQHGPAQR